MNKPMDNDLILLLNDIEIWLCSYIVDTPESRTYAGAEDLARRVGKVVPPKQGANRKPNTFSRNEIRSEGE